MFVIASEVPVTVEITRWRTTEAAVDRFPEVPLLAAASSPEVPLQRAGNGNFYPGRVLPRRHAARVRRDYIMKPK